MEVYILSPMNSALFKQCVKISSPIFFGYIAIGMPFGLMIVNAGYPWWISLVMSIFMYAGAGQYIAVGLFASGASLAEVFIAELLVNIRHIVYGLSLIDKFKNCGKWKPYLIFALTDETYALLTSTDLPPDAEPGPFFGTIALLDHLYWICGCVLGAVACNILLHFNLSQYIAGVDFALTALFVVILIEQIKKTQDYIPPVIGIAAGTIAVVLFKVGLLPVNNILLVAITVAITVLILVRGRNLKEQTE